MRRQLNINIWLHWTGEERDIWRTSTRLCVYRSIVSDRTQNKTRCSTPHCLRCLLLHPEEMRAINLSSPAPSETTSLHDTPTLVWLGEDLNDTRFCCRRRLDFLAALTRVYYPDDFNKGSMHYATYLSDVEKGQRPDEEGRNLAILWF
ncbi:hypothetical protein RRG08_014919 [Elysia crispata]|uniref:Uncharacterized protein n=1 Tax=Elysia crispata TaxID=231223 RepID=A0AAE0ZTN1_9GAST|nr:hypothetical protein RRG08_014919 [Elysia crispata]